MHDMAVMPLLLFASIGVQVRPCRSVSHIAGKEALLRLLLSESVNVLDRSNIAGCRLSGLVPVIIGNER